MQLKTITLPDEMPFIEALTQLLAGTCLGIRPGKNVNFIEMFKPAWMSVNSPDFILKWSDSDSPAEIRTNQYMESWRLVVVDHRELPKLIKKPELTT